MPHVVELRDRGRIGAFARHDDLPAIETLYRQSYPGNWFDARMLDTKQYFGVRDEAGALTCIAGVHVFSATQRGFAEIAAYDEQMLHARP
jgi:hypothetical protein